MLPPPPPRLLLPGDADENPPSPPLSGHPGILEGWEGEGGDDEDTDIVVKLGWNICVSEGR